MIKWDGYGKLLKQLFSILLIGFFGLLGNSFVNAGCYGPASSSSVDNRIECDNVSYDYIYKGVGGVFDYKLNFTDGIFQYKIDNDNILSYWWSFDGLNYTYKNGNNSSNGVVDGFFYFNSSVGNDVSVYLKNRGNIISFNNLGNYLDNSYQYVDYYCGIIRSSSLPNCIVCLTQGTDSGHICVDLSNISVSNNSYISPDNISPSLNPFINGGDLVGSSNVNVDNNLSGDYSYTTCTYKEIYDYSSSVGVSPNLCYGGLDNFDLYDSSITYNPIPGTGKTLGQILSNAMSAWDTPKDWFNFWNGLRGGYVSMWESYPAVYKTWFDIYYSYNGDLFDFDYVREYCIMYDLIKNNPSVLDNVYQGKYFTQTCNYIKRNPNISSSGQVSLGVNRNGVGNMGNGETFTNPKVAIQSFFDRLKSNLTTDYIGLGFIPQYIIFFLMALILFRFLSH